MATINLRVNGRAQTVDADPDSPLLYVLADDLKLNGPKFGCGLAQCGACTVLFDGEPIRSCTTSVGDVAGHEITTIEGLGTIDRLHPIQKAFIDEQAIQCGFCLSGPMLYGKVFIDKNPGASEAQIVGALNGLICRCHTHVRMVKALQRYAQEVRR
jgi:nicotinate dehydrogenase subunit A